MLTPQLNRIALLLTLAAFSAVHTGCLKKSEKQRPYYYSQEEVDSHKENGETVVDIASTTAVRQFMAGKTFASKTYRIEISDSLAAVVTNNGKPVFAGTCEVGEFMINDERLMFITDETGEKHRFTLAHNGLLTDKATYALYHPVTE